MTIGTLVAFTTLQAGLFRPLMGLLNVGVSLTSSLALFARIFEYLDLPVEVDDPAHPVAGRPGRGAPGTCASRTSRSPTRAATPPRSPASTWTCPAGTHAGPGRRDRLGQEHARRAGRPALRPDRRPDHHRRRRPARHAAGRPGRGRRRGQPGDLPAAHHGPGEPALRQAGRHRRRDRGGRPGRADPRPDRRACPTATTPWSAPAGTGSPAARSSASRSPARCCATRASWCSTRRPARWTTRPSAPCSGPSTSWPAAAPRSPSRTGCRPSATPTRSPCSTTAGSSSPAPTPTLVAAGGRYAALAA